MFKGLNEIMALMRTCVPMLANIRIYKKYFSGNLEVKRPISGIKLLIRIMEGAIEGSSRHTKKDKKRRQEERQTDRQENSTCNLPLDIQALTGPPVQQ